jgi:hypothetical protein
MNSPKFVTFEVFMADYDLIYRHVVLGRTDVSEECIASIIRVRRISEPGTLAVTN